MTSSMALAMAMGRQSDRQQDRRTQRDEKRREEKRREERRGEVRRGRWQCIEFIALEECGVRLSRQGNAGGTVREREGQWDSGGERERSVPHNGRN